MSLSSIPEPLGSTLSTTKGACVDEIDNTRQLHCARWAGFGLSVYQPINLVPRMTSLHGLSESKGKSSCSYIKINYENRENWRENCLTR